MGFSDATQISFMLYFSLFNRCKLPDYENDTYLVQNDYHRSLIDKYIPRENGPNATDYDQCNINVFANQTSTENDSLTEPSRQRCSAWIFSKGTYGKTIVTEVNNVVI
jgi:OCT family organic cation transporter-like MFS transporter 4/5